MMKQLEKERAAPDSRDNVKSRDIFQHILDEDIVCKGAEAALGLYDSPDSPVYCPPPIDFEDEELEQNKEDRDSQLELTAEIQPRKSNSDKENNTEESTDNSDENVLGPC